MPKISQFPAGGVAQNTDLIPIVRNGGDFTVSGYNLAALASYGQAYAGTFTGDGSTKTFTLPASPGSLANLFIAVNGVTKVPTTDYSWTTPTTLTFVTAPANGAVILYQFTSAVPIGTPNAGGINGQVQYNNSGVLNGFTMSGDVTVVPTTGVATVNAPATHINYTQGGTGSVARTVTNKLQESVSVKDFGAVGDGSTNDTTAIQAAITACAVTGKTLFFPAGQYVTGLLVLPQQNGGIELVGEAYDASNALVSSTYFGAVLISTTATGNIISCDGGAAYVNRGIRIRNLSIKVATSGYAIYLKNCPEQVLLENLTIYNYNASGGFGVGLESCWGGARVSNCQISASVIGTTSFGLYVFNALKAGGLLVENSSIIKFWKNVFIGDLVYQATFLNVEFAAGTYGFYINGNSNITLDTCHAESNTENAIYLKTTTGFRIVNCSFYRNGETAAGTKAEIYVSSGSSDYNYNLLVQKNSFFGVGTNVTAVYISNSSYGSGVVDNNSFNNYGGATGTVGLYVGGANTEYWEITNNEFGSAATPYNPTNGYKRMSPALGGHYGIRFAATQVPSTDANTLDDYEEGLWTPVLGGDGGTPSGQTYTIQQGRYQKVGNRVHFTFKVAISVVGSISGNAALLGLPFPLSAAAGTAYGAISDFANLGVTVTTLTLTPNVGSSGFYFKYLTAAAASTSYGTYSMYTTSTVIVGGGTYMVD